MVPMNTGDNVNDNGNENLARMIETGQIPDELMNQILQAAESYMEMFNRNPSKFLKRYRKSQREYVLSYSLGPFDYLHQHSHKLHFKIHSNTLLFVWKYY